MNTPRTVEYDQILERLDQIEGLLTIVLGGMNATVERLGPLSAEQMIMVREQRKIAQWLARIEERLDAPTSPGGPPPDWMPGRRRVWVAERGTGSWEDAGTP